MFVEAIEIAGKFTRPIHSIMRNYRSSIIQPGAVTLFFVNSDGWALTCKHVATQIVVAESLKQKYDAFKRELSSLEGTMKKTKLIKQLEKKHGYSKHTPVELHNRFMNCVEGDLKFSFIIHKKYDVALINFKDYSRLLCDAFPVFPLDTSSLLPGKYLCRLGYPFPEFRNYAYDDKTDMVNWTDTGKETTPRFPIEGMVTRRLLDTERKGYGFEMSTPGLRGQSGGPAFDVEGKVWGMQFATGHLDLDFDVDQEVLRSGTKKHVTDSAFLHVGVCIHVDVLKSFMRENNISFSEE